MNQEYSETKKKSGINWPVVALVIVLAAFMFYAVGLALNLGEVVIPDETYRYAISRYFAETWGIPQDVPIVIESGEDLARNPFLGYWIFGRIISFETWIAPESTQFQQLVGLRLVNSLFALGVLIITYFMAKLLVKNRWLQVLPVFLLANTMMFVFLAGGVSYDNPTNLACAFGIFFLVRILKGRNLLSNSIGWLFALLIATLIKYSVLPLLLFTVIIWVVYVIKHPGILRTLKPNHWLQYVLLVLLAFLIIGNILLYGGNLLQFHSLTPNCTDIYSEEFCEQNVFAQRYRELGLSERLTIREAVKQGYPEPIRYFFEDWVRIMLMRTFGIAGHEVYYPQVISYFEIALLWLALLGARYVRKLDFKMTSLLLLVAAYAAVLFVMNYNNELVYGFIHLSFQGRYFFPVIGLAFVLVSFLLEQVDHKILRTATVVALIALFFYSGPIRFILYHDTIFSSWFV